MAGRLFAWLTLSLVFVFAEKIHDDIPAQSVTPHTRFMRGQDTCNTNMTNIPDNDVKGISSTLTIVNPGEITEVKLV